MSDLSGRGPSEQPRDLMKALRESLEVATGRGPSEQPRDLMKALRESLEVATGRSLSSTEEAAMSGECHQEPWWSINGGVLLDALRRANRGEDADLIYAELYAKHRVPGGLP